MLEKAFIMPAMQQQLQQEHTLIKYSSAFALHLQGFYVQQKMH